MPIVQADNLLGVAAVDASVNIGTSGSPTMISVTTADGCGNSPPTGGNFSFGDLTLKGFRWWSTTYNVGPSGKTTTTEYIDGGAVLLDGTYIALDCMDAGQYYTYQTVKHEWIGEPFMEWAAIEGQVAPQVTLARSEYLTFWNKKKNIYLRYLAAVRNVEALRANREREEDEEAEQEGVAASPHCEEQSDRVEDVLLRSASHIPGSGKFAVHRDTILNFPSWPNPITERGELYYKFGELGVPAPPGVPTGAIFNDTGTLRSVLGSICSRAGCSFYWDPVANTIKYIKPEDIDVPGSNPASAVSASWGTTMANGSVNHSIFTRYIPGKEWPQDMTNWKWRRIYDGDTVFNTIVSTITELKDAEPAPEPPEGEEPLVKWAIPSSGTVSSTYSELDYALFYIEVGEEVFRALWIKKNSEDFPDGDSVIKARIKEIGVYGDEKISCLVEGLEDEAYTDCDESLIDKYTLRTYNEEDLEELLVKMRSFAAYASLYKSCHPSESTGAEKFKILDYDDPLNPYLLKLGAFGEDTMSKLDWDMVDVNSTCDSVGAVSINKHDDMILETEIGNIMGSMVEDDPCTDADISGMTVEDFIGGSSDWALIGTNNTWSYNYDQCLTTGCKDWAKDALIELSADLGPAAFGKSPGVEFLKNMHYAETGELVPDKLVGVKKDLFLDTSGYVLPAYSGGGVLGLSLPSRANIIFGKQMAFSASSEVATDTIGGTGHHTTTDCNLCNTFAANTSASVIKSGPVGDGSGISEFKANKVCDPGPHPHRSYTLHGKVGGDFSTGINWSQTIAALESLNISLSSGGITATYNFGTRKAIIPGIFIISGGAPEGPLGTLSQHSTLGSLSPRFKSNFMGTRP
jgi:hypothetical protein